jgi:flagellar basal-body rod protein FlgG
VTADGLPVLGDQGPIVLEPGDVAIENDGTVRAGGVAAGRLQVVDVADYGALAREEAGRFRAGPGAAPARKDDATVRGRSLEQSNVSLPERMVKITEVARAFEGLQRGIAVLMNEVDGRAISELGRR